MSGYLHRCQRDETNLHTGLCRGALRRSALTTGSAHTLAYVKQSNLMATDIITTAAWQTASAPTRKRGLKVTELARMCHKTLTLLQPIQTSPLQTQRFKFHPSCNTQPSTTPIHTATTEASSHAAQARLAVGALPQLPQRAVLVLHQPQVNRQTVYGALGDATPAA